MSDLNTQVSSAVEGLTREYNIIANNLANINTAGFKRRCNAFSKLLDAQNSANGSNSDNDVNLTSAFDFSQGSFTDTGSKLDVAICGKGFFVIQSAQGPLYTRNGSFHLNTNNQLVDLSGRIVSGANGPITVPAEVNVAQINIGTDGTISANGNQIGKFKIRGFSGRRKQTRIGRLQLLQRTGGC